MKDTDLRAFRFLRLLTPISALACAAVFASPGPVQAQGLAGPYLAARVADRQRDFAAVVEYGIRAMVQDPGNIELLQQILVADIGLGQIDHGVPIARRLLGLEPGNQIAGLVLLADAVREERWDEVLSLLEETRAVNDTVDGLIRGWALIGQGRSEAALELFDTLAENDDLGHVAAYHAALARAAIGDFEAAARRFSGAEGTLELDREGVIAYAQILSQLARNPVAIDLIDKVFPNGGDAGIQALRAELAAGKSVPFDAVTSPRQAVADLFGALAQALARDLQPEIVLLYARTAEHMDPENDAAALLAGTLLEILDQYELAIPAYGRVSADSPLHERAALARAEALRRWGREDEAVAALEELARDRPDSARVFKTLGDSYRFMGRCEAALAPYDRAVELIAPAGQAAWSLFFARGICHERLDQWPQAEADFLRALELNPDQPAVLNYLGYSWVEQERNLDRALKMIRRAVEARPDDGYIADSLGWVYYRLGRFDDAVIEMERAVALKPIDPVLNDHLGDVYWAVGRRLEARFQWKRALSFITDDTDLDEVRPDRIRRKLEVGLDQVLEEEGARPLAELAAQAAQDDEGG